MAKAAASNAAERVKEYAAGMDEILRIFSSMTGKNALVDRIRPHLVHPNARDRDGEGWEEDDGNE